MQWPGRLFRSAEPRILSLFFFCWYEQAQAPVALRIAIRQWSGEHYPADIASWISGFAPKIAMDTLLSTVLDSISVSQHWLNLSCWHCFSAICRKLRRSGALALANFHDKVYQ
jgi:hypothetical protein